jgi:NTP pyrophosphatase (non-canonical NTP hydrolase)
MEEMIERAVRFVKARDWEQFHNPKDLAVSLTLEAAEVLEHFQWKSPEEMAKHLKNHKTDVAEELSDVLYWVLLMSHYFDIDLQAAFDTKMDQNEKKYPKDKARGRHDKYTAYQG